RAISFLVSLVIIFVTFLLWEWREEIGFSILYYMVGFLCLAQAWHDLNLKIQNAILQPLTYGKMLLIKGAGSFFIGVLLVYFGFGVDGFCWVRLCLWYWRPFSSKMRGGESVGRW
ncbi:hypothetical protein, partial [Pseudomonas aeruginosa]|uniref:hypothetical protein n=1 Tax=Pseudomonas aeruginosa TaxID=287 RepID=UPI0031B6DACB